MRALRVPRALREIEVRNEEDGAIISRQAVRRHLDHLLVASVVETRSGEREYGEATEYVVNHQRVFAVSEELRALARLRAAVEPEGETVVGSAEATLRREGPQLVLVRGLDEGTTYPLAGPAGSMWILGRSRHATIPLDFDPSVSSQNALIQEEAGALYLGDIAGSRNGTFHNMRRLGPEERVQLSHGDLVGVGRCLLLFWQ